MESVSYFENGPISYKLRQEKKHKDKRKEGRKFYAKHDAVFESVISWERACATLYERWAVRDEEEEEDEEEERRKRKKTSKRMRRRYRE